MHGYIIITIKSVLLVENDLPSLCAGASVSLPIEPKKYLKLLVEQAMLQFFVAVKVKESKQLFLKVRRA